MAEFIENMGGIVSGITLTTIISFIVYLVTIMKGVQSLKSLKFKNKETLTTVKKAVVDSNKVEIKVAVKEEMEKYMPKILAAQEKQTEVLKAFTKVLILQQENTAESKVACLNVLENLGTISSETIAASKKVVENIQNAVVEKQEKVQEDVKEIIELTHTEIM